MLSTVFFGGNLIVIEEKVISMGTKSISPGFHVVLQGNQGQMWTSSTYYHGSQE